MFQATRRRRRLYGHGIGSDAPGHEKAERYQAELNVDVRNAAMQSCMFVGLFL
jgi:hypothetical protein